MAKAKVNMTIDDRLRTWLVHLAYYKNTTMTNVIESMLIRSLKENGLYEKYMGPEITLPGVDTEVDLLIEPQHQQQSLID